MSTQHKISIYSCNNSIIKALKRFLKYKMNLSDDEIFTETITENYDLNPKKSDIGLYILPYSLNRIYINDLFLIDHYVNKKIIMGIYNKKNITDVNLHGDSLISEEKQNQLVQSSLISNKCMEIIGQIKNIC